jgi:hypothetical protein
MQWPLNQEIRGEVVGPDQTVPCTSVSLNVFKHTHLLTSDPNTRERPVTVAAMLMLQTFEVKTRPRLELSIRLQQQIHKVSLLVLFLNFRPSVPFLKS